MFTQIRAAIALACVLALVGCSVTGTSGGVVGSTDVGSGSSESMGVIDNTEQFQSVLTSTSSPGSSTTNDASIVPINISLGLPSPGISSPVSSFAQNLPGVPAIVAAAQPLTDVVAGIPAAVDQIGGPAGTPVLSRAPGLVAVLAPTLGALPGQSAVLPVPVPAPLAPIPGGLVLQVGSLPGTAPIVSPTNGSTVPVVTNAVATSTLQTVRSILSGLR